MKKLIRLLTIIMALVVCAVSFAACGNAGSNKKDENGLVCKKFGDDEFYTVTRYYEEEGVTSLDISAAAKAKYGENAVVGAIKKGAFNGNSSLKEVIVKEGDIALVIAEGAFNGMKSLTKITLPFVGATAVSDAYVSETEPKENKSVDEERSFGYIFGHDVNDYASSVSMNYGKDSASFAIPASLAEITIDSGDKAINVPMYAFYGLAQVSVINLKGNIQAIGDSAFKNMTKLNKVNIPASVTAIYDNAFEGATALKTFGEDFKFDNGSSLATIGNSSFKGTNLTDFVLPATVKAIGESCFAESALTAFTFSQTIESVGAYAFYNSSKLATITNAPADGIVGVNAFVGTALSA